MHVMIKGLSHEINHPARHGIEYIVEPKDVKLERFKNGDSDNIYYWAKIINVVNNVDHKIFNVCVKITKEEYNRLADILVNGVSVSSGVKVVDSNLDGLEI